MYGQIKIPPEKNAPQSLHGEDQGGIYKVIESIQTPIYKVIEVCI